MIGTVDTSAVIARAHALMAMGRGEQAIDTLSPALVQDPQNPDLLAQMAVLLHDVRFDLPAADRAARAALAEDPTQVDALIILSYVHRASKNEKTAIAAAREAVRLAPDEASSHLTLARALTTLTTSFPTEALAAADRALALAPHSPHMFTEVARFERQIGQETRAKKHIEHGLSLAPADTTLLTMRAAGPGMLRGDAVATLQAVLAQQPTSIAARRALADRMWDSIARLASGVWWFVAAVVLLSMWIGPDVLATIKIALFLPIIFMWIGVFKRLRRQLPPGYFRRRVATRPEAWIGLSLAFLAGLVADVTPVLLTHASSSGETRGAYIVMLFACVLAGLAHLSVNLGRARRRRSESTADAPETVPVTVARHLTDSAFGVALIGAVFVLLLWAVIRWSPQPGALCVLTALGAMVVATMIVEAAAVSVLYRPGFRRDNLVLHTIMLVAAALVLWWMFTTIAGYDFAYTAPELDVPTFKPIHIPTMAPITPWTVPPAPPGG